MADSVVKTKKTRAIRQKGKAFRQQEPLLAVLQWGVNHCINELLCVPEKQLLLQQDFKAHHKININNQYYNDHELPSKFKVKEYCPLVFRDIRQRFQEDPDDYLYSLCDGPLSSRESSGRSGATFHTSHDLRVSSSTNCAIPLVNGRQTVATKKLVWDRLDFDSQALLQFLHACSCSWCSKRCPRMKLASFT
eukprot:TRINITY_DN10573_c0_g1_i3.p1 TRINITY_DN10573_c0_g1~~TRINITY_DN10573_c0_g1_i3.p1  ORF type:complete len:192 (+),score=25.62 TRINITY_DN10573_c0_g1_i3:208-783(+)